MDGQDFCMVQVDLFDVGLEVFFWQRGQVSGAVGTDIEQPVSHMDKMVVATGQDDPLAQADARHERIVDVFDVAAKTLAYFSVVVSR